MSSHGIEQSVDRNLERIRAVREGLQARQPTRITACITTRPIADSDREVVRGGSEVRARQTAPQAISRSGPRKDDPPAPLEEPRAKNGTRPELGSAAAPVRFENRPPEPSCPPPLPPPGPAECQLPIGCHECFRNLELVEPSDSLRDAPSNGCAHPSVLARSFWPGPASFDTFKDYRFPLVRY
jgi:hypothetical protein